MQGARYVLHSKAVRQKGGVQLDPDSDMMSINASLYSCSESFAWQLIEHAH